MLDQKESALKLYSFGIVVEDKPRTTDVILVYPVEDIPFINGKISDFSDAVKQNIFDSKNTSKAVDIDLKATIEAKWISYGQSNRHSAPDVIKSETVLIFRFGETNKFYWTTVFNEPSIRRLETVVTRVGATSSYGVTLGDSNSYTMVISAHDKFVRFTTSKANGEPVKYTLLLDLKTGKATFEDDKENSFNLDSIKGTLDVNIKEKITFNTKVFNINATNSYNLSTSRGVVSASSYTIDAPSFTATAPVSNLTARYAICC